MNQVKSSDNPYQSPQFDDPAFDAEMLDGGGEAEAVRRKYIAHETSVRSVGLLYYLGAAICGMGSLGFAIMLFTGSSLRKGGGGDRTFMMVLAAIYPAFCILSFFVGRGIRRLESWTRPVIGVLSSLGLLGIPFGTIINAYILWLFFSEKGRVVFQPQYKQIIAKTPHVKYRTSLAAWIALIAIIGLIILAVFFSMRK